MKKWITLLLVAALLCPLLGCGEEGITLWVVTEETTWDQMNGQAWVLQAAFEEAHPGVKLNIDILPTAERERSAYLQKLRTKILQGRGPDIYLLPTDTTLTIGDAGKIARVDVEPLFSDVKLAMGNGLFMDISAFYDADEALGKESFNAAVMDGGVVDGARYVLPLRYDLPVIYAEKWTLEEKGFDTAVLEKPLPEIMEEALKTGDPLILAGALYDGTGIFADWIDYNAGDAALKQEDLAAYMQVFQTLVANTEDYNRAVRLSVTNYVNGVYDNNQSVRCPLYIGSLKDLLEYAPVAQYEQSDYAILPLQAVGGGTVATVTYYAAIGSNCKNPQLAYEYLRQFLLEESQWEDNRPEKMNLIIGVPPSKTIQDKSTKTQQPGLIADGWPVRIQGSLNPVWDIRRIQFYSKSSGNDRVRTRKIGLSPLQEQYGQILEAPITDVRFPSVADGMLETELRDLNLDWQHQYQPADVDIQELAKAFLWELRRHIAEG